MIAAESSCLEVMGGGGLCTIVQLNTSQEKENGGSKELCIMMRKKMEAVLHIMGERKNSATGSGGALLL